MKTQDLQLSAALAALVAAFALWPALGDAYTWLNASHPYLLAFLKFALLSTLGEAIGLRIKTGRYNEPGFGLLPRAVVWGVLGVWIAAAMKTFAVGAPQLVDTMGAEGVTAAMKGSFSGLKLLGAMAISIAMNTTFGPVFMTVHKITDTHILNNGGSLRALIRPIAVRQIVTQLNWEVMWGFVFKRTIPLFWIPAHTITFLLPPDVQVLFAALLGICLGVLLSMAAVMARKE